MVEIILLSTANDSSENVISSSKIVLVIMIHIKLYNCICLYEIYISHSFDILKWGLLLFSATTPRGELKKLTRRKSTPEALQRSQPRSPTGYDW